MRDDLMFQITVAGEPFHGRAGSRLQSALQRAHGEHPALCLCRAEPIRLVIKRYHGETDTPVFGLARWPDTGYDHQPNCYFFGEEALPQDTGEVRPAIEELENGRSRVYLATALRIIERNIQAIAAKKAKDPAVEKRHRASEVILLMKVWRSAGLNVYRGQQRKWFHATFSILRAASQIVINSDGETLDQYLLVAAHSGDQLAAKHNQAVLEKAKPKYTRLFVIGRLKSFTRDKDRQMLRLQDFAGIPRISIKLAQYDQMLGDRPFLLDLMTSGAGNLVVIACIEPGTGDWWSTLNINGMATSLDFVPVETQAELDFDRYLVSEKRKFIRPILMAGTAGDTKRPEFILLDSNPRTYCEVFDGQSAAEPADRAELTSMFDARGKHYVSWNAAGREAYPALPAHEIASHSQ